MERLHSVRGHWGLDAEEFEVLDFSSQASMHCSPMRELLVIMLMAVNLSFIYVVSLAKSLYPDSQMLAILKALI